MFWAVEVTTHRKDGKVVLDRSSATDGSMAKILAEKTAEIMFGDDYTCVYPQGREQPMYLGENHWDEDVYIEYALYSFEPRFGTFVSA